jgi:chemotaxis protein CheZ
MDNDIGKVIFNKIQELREDNGGKIQANNIDEIVEKLVEVVKGQITTEEDMAAYEELQKIYEQIQNTKKEVSSIDSSVISEDFVPSAASELSSITESTEKSTEKILDCTEQIQNIANGLDNEEAKQKIIDQAMQIFEACNFQDITGQRINRVISTLDEIETAITAMINTFGAGMKKKVVPSKASEKKEEDLLNGPQGDGSAPSQQDIDDLFDSL